MVACGMAMFAVIGFCFIQICRRKIGTQPWLLKATVCAIPLPWIASEAGWFVAEFGRQPWAIGEVLPVNMAVSHLSTSDLWISLGVVYLLYSVFLVIEMYLMVKFARRGQVHCTPAVTILKLKMVTVFYLMYTIKGEYNV